LRNETEETIMSSDNQFTAVGPAAFGFFTDATQITYGVNVQGVDAVTSKFGAGVYAESMLHSPGLRKSQDNSRSGVWGVGDHYGVYGASDKLYGGPQPDNTPILSPDEILGTDPNAPNAKGGIGVVGASLNVPGVIGTSDVTDHNNGGLFLNGIIPHTAGVMGLSNTSMGVMGVNVSSVPKNSNPPQQILALLTPGTPQSNAGVFGWSMNGRGGVFGSAEPVVFGPPIPRPPPDQGHAQVRLLPNVVSEARVVPQPPEAGPPPTLPHLGQPGDLIAVTVVNPDGNLGHAELWFCIEAGSIGGAPALWGQVQFSRVIEGVNPNI
jgi:hypothetical protein